MDIISLLACFQPLVAAVTLRHFSPACAGDFDDDGADYDVRHLAVDGKRRELPHREPIFCDHFAVGQTIY